MSNDTSFRPRGEGVAAKIERNRTDTDVEEVLTDNVHLIPLPDLPCLQQDEAQLHQDDIDRCDDDPVFKEPVFEVLGHGDIVVVRLAGELRCESVI